MMNPVIGAAETITELKAQLETARKMFEAIIKTDGKYAIRQSQIALAQIGALPEPEKS